MIVFGLIALVAYFVADYVYISKQLRKHQTEWNRRKANAIASGERLEDAYCEYLDYLVTFEWNPIFGIGIPKF
jgi:hypothetical protein